MHIKIASNGGLVKVNILKLTICPFKVEPLLPASAVFAGQVFCKTIRHFNCFNLSFVVKVYQLLFYRNFSGNLRYAGVTLKKKFSPFPKVFEF